MLKALLLLCLVAWIMATPTNCNSGTCRDRAVCLQKCSQIYPGCTAQTFAELRTEHLVPAHYFQHSCMYRWGKTATESWMFNMIWTEYEKLVSQHGYPQIRKGNIQRFEMDTYGVCAGQKKCAGFGLSAMLSAYFGFAQQCQQRPPPKNADLQAELDRSRGQGYGGADGNIKYWDANPTRTYQILNSIKPLTDRVFLSRIRNNNYDYCPCDTYQNFHNFISNEVVPHLAAGSTSTWLGTSASVYIAGPQYYTEWRKFGPTISSQILRLKKWCAKKCGK